MLFIPGLLNTKSARKLTNEEARHKRNEIFNEEKARQLAFITRIEKIQVEHKGPPEDCTLIMNKGLSTPFNCAMRKYYCSYSHEVFGTKFCIRFQRSNVSSVVSVSDHEQKSVVLNPTS